MINEEERKFLYKEIMRRIPYGVRVIVNGEDTPRYASELDITHNMELLDKIKLYLRPIPLDLHEDERKEIEEIGESYFAPDKNDIKCTQIYTGKVPQCRCFGDGLYFENVINGSVFKDFPENCYFVNYYHMHKFLEYLDEHQFDYNNLRYLNLATWYCNMKDKNGNPYEFRCSD